MEEDAQMIAFRGEWPARLPRFNYLILFNDHTNGTTPGDYTPKANVADNDARMFAPFVGRNALLDP